MTKRQKLIGMVCVFVFWGRGSSSLTVAKFRSVGNCRTHVVLPQERIRRRNHSTDRDEFELELKRVRAATIAQGLDGRDAETVGHMEKSHFYCEEKEKENNDKNSSLILVCAWRSSAVPSRDGRRELEVMRVSACGLQALNRVGERLERRRSGIRTAASPHS